MINPCFLAPSRSTEATNAGAPSFRLSREANAELDDRDASTRTVQAASWTWHEGPRKGCQGEKTRTTEYLERQAKQWNR